MPFRLDRSPGVRGGMGKVSGEEYLGGWWSLVVGVWGGVGVGVWGGSVGVWVVGWLVVGGPTSGQYIDGVRHEKNLQLRSIVARGLGASCILILDPAT